MQITLKFMVYPGFIVALSIDKLQFIESFICKPSYTCFSLAIFINKVFCSSKWTYQMNCFMINYSIWFCNNNMWRQQTFKFFSLTFSAILSTIGVPCLSINWSKCNLCNKTAFWSSNFYVEKKIPTGGKYSL